MIRTVLVGWSGGTDWRALSAAPMDGGSPSVARSGTTPARRHFDVEEDRLSPRPRILGRRIGGPERVGGDRPPRSSRGDRDRPLEPTTRRGLVRDLLDESDDEARGGYPLRPVSAKGNDLMASTNPSPIDAAEAAAAITVTTSDLASAAPQPPASAPGGAELYPKGSPAPRGTDPVAEKDASAATAPTRPPGVGVDGEVVVWEARYSKRNFIGRISIPGRPVGRLGLAGLLYLESMDIPSTSLPPGSPWRCWFCLWASLIWRMIQAYYSHYYRLTNRRSLRLDRGHPPSTRHDGAAPESKTFSPASRACWSAGSSWGRWWSSPPRRSCRPSTWLGVDDPKQVMDLIWHHARAERDQRSVKVTAI